MSSPKKRRWLVAVSVAVTSALVLAGCATATPNAQSVPSQNLVTIVKATELKTDSQWTLTDGPDPSSTGVVSIQAALATARQEVRGQALTPDSKPRGALAYVTNTASGDQTVVNLLAWVIEISGIQIPISRPSASSTDTTTFVGTVQWVIDAKTGEYVEARDF